MATTTRAKARPARRKFRLAGIASLVILSSLAVGGDVSSYSASPYSVTIAMPPPTDEVRILLTNTPLAITPVDALALNAARSIDRVPVYAARPFLIPPAAGGEANAALECLTQAIYFEAASESDTGKRAVAQVVINRMRSPIFPHTICGVVFQGSQQRTGCQFSFTCDGSLARRPSFAGWIAARRIALAALAGRVERSVGLATHYHANYVVPYWASSLDKAATIGAHIFYTMRGGLGRPAAFGARYDAAAEALPSTPAAGDPTVDPLAEVTVGDGTGMPANPAPQPPPNRTTVQDDLLGVPSRPNLAPVAPKPALRADETKSELVADKNKGVLSR